MKTFITKTLLCIIVTTVFTLPAKAQDYDFSSIRINGLELYEQYTREQFIEALGVPDTEDDAVYSYFIYEGVQPPALIAGNATPTDIKPRHTVSDAFGYSSFRDGRMLFVVFSICTDRFAINDYVRVGDPVEKVFDMGGATVDFPDEDGGGLLYWSPYKDTIPEYELMYCPGFSYNENGLIENIMVYYD